MADTVCKKLGLNVSKADLNEWKTMVKKAKRSKHKVTVAIVGKYVKLHDAYLSIAEALHHAGYEHSANVKIRWIDSECIDESNVKEKLKDIEAIIVPGGFGKRGIEGMIVTAKYCRENNVPYLGICLGMQVAVIEFARNVAKLENANSGEFDDASPHKVIDFLPDQSDATDKGGTLRLGSYDCVLKQGSLIHSLYGTDQIKERHRHRYEFNNQYRETLSDAGMILSGMSPDGHIVETMEYNDNNYFIGVQFHPEFKSRPNRPHPLFLGLIAQAIKDKELL